MSDLRTRIVLDLTGNLEARARQAGSALDQMGRRGAAGMATLGRGIRSASDDLDRLGNRYTALLTGAVGIGTGRMLMALEERFTRLGIQGNVAADEIERLKGEIFAVARTPDIRVDPGQIIGAIEEIVEKTGDLEFARHNIRNIGLALQATGADGKAIGGIFAELQKGGVIDPAETLAIIDTLNVQGKEGAFTLQNMAALGPRLFAAYAATGAASRGVSEATREMGAALQVIRQGTGSSEEAATAFESMLRTFQDADKIEMLRRKGGIQVFDPEALKEGREVLRPINELIAEIVVAAKGRATLIGEVFDARAMRAFNAAIGEYQRTGAVTAMERFMEMHGDGATTMRDSARAAATANAATRNLYTAWQRFADANLTKHIQSLADGLNSLDEETVDRWLRIGGALAAGAAALVVANKVGRAGVGLYGLLRGGRGGLPGTGGVGGAGGVGRPVPVWVVNSGAFKGSGAGGVAAGAAAAKGGGILTAGGPLLPAAIAGGLAVGSMEAGKWLAEREARSSSDQRLRELRMRHLVMGGGERSYQVELINRELERRGEESARPRWLYPAGSEDQGLSPAARAAELADALERPLARALAGYGAGGGQKIIPVPGRPPEQTVGGKITLVIDDRRTRVQSIRADNPAVDLEVESGLTMRGH